MEIAVMSELLSAWSDTIKYRKGIFSNALEFVHFIKHRFLIDFVACSYDDPFYHPIQYAPTDKEIIDRSYNTANRLLTPHGLILQMLLSRLQAARYRRPGVMFLIQHLVLRSARSHRWLRCVRFPFSEE